MCWRKRTMNIESMSSPMDHLSTTRQRPIIPHMRENYVVKKAMMVVKKAVKAGRYYLQSRHFIIVTHHKPLFWLMTTPHLRGKFARLAIQLSEYDFEIMHRACTKHINVDALSRLTKKDVGREPLENELLATTAYTEIDIWTQPESILTIQEADVEEDSPPRQYEWKEGLL